MQTLTTHAYRIGGLAFAVILGVALSAGSARAQEQASALSQARPLTIPEPIDPALLVETDEPTIFWMEPDGISDDSLTVGSSSLALRGRLTNAGDSLSLLVGFEQIPLDENGFFEADLTLRLGANESRVRVLDEDGSVVIQKPLYIRYDDVTPPDIRVYEPVPVERPQIHRSIRARMQFTGRVFDESEIEAFAINETGIALAEDNLFSHSVLLQDGRINTVFLTATDAAGNTARDSVKVVRETGLKILPSLLAELAFRPGRLSPAFTPVEQYYTLILSPDADMVEISSTAFEGTPSVRIFGAGLPEEGALLRPGDSRPFPVRIPAGPQRLEIRSSGPNASPVTYTIRITRSR